MLFLYLLLLSWVAMASMAMAFFILSFILVWSPEPPSYALIGGLMLGVTAIHLLFASIALIRLRQKIARGTLFLRLILKAIRIIPRFLRTS